MTIQSSVDILKVSGSIFVIAGSVVLAIRVKILIDQVIHTLVAHESSIEGLGQVIQNQRQTFPVVKGYIKHLLDTRDKPGTKLLFAGFAFIALGAALQAIAVILPYFDR